MMRLEDYPPDIQDLLKWAGHHLEQLERLEHDFREWQAEQTLGCSTSIEVVLSGEGTILPPLTPAGRSERARLLGVHGTTRANAARARWETRMWEARRG